MNEIFRVHCVALLPAAVGKSHPGERDEAGTDILSALRNRAINAVANALPSPPSAAWASSRAVPMKLHGRLP